MKGRAHICFVHILMHQNTHDRVILDFCRELPPHTCIWSHTFFSKCQWDSYITGLSYCAKIKLYVYIVCVAYMWHCPVYSEVQLRLNIPSSVGFNFVLHGKVHANYMTGVTSSHHKSSLPLSLVPQWRVGTYINYCVYTHDQVIFDFCGELPPHVCIWSRTHILLFQLPVRLIYH